MSQGTTTPKENTCRQYMASNSNGKRCSRCGDEVLTAKGVACICWRCTNLLAELCRLGHFKGQDVSGKRCPDCNGPLPKYKSRCLGCAKKHQRALKAKTARKRRGPVSDIRFSGPVLART